MAEVTIRLADLGRDMAAVERLCWAYRDDLHALEGASGALAQRLFTDDAWGAMLKSLPALHARPAGAVLLVEQAGEALGCGMLHPLSTDDAEIKRVYIAPPIRGTGMGERLTRALIDQARRDGYRRILLDTTRASHGAQRLYEKLGFTARGPYADLPAEMAEIMVYYERAL